MKTNKKDDCGCGKPLRINDPRKKVIKTTKKKRKNLLK